MLSTTEKALNIFLNLLSAPQCKLLNIIDKLCSLLYADVADACINILLSQQNPEPFLTILKVSHLHTLILQEQYRALSPSINLVLIKSIDAIQACSNSKFREKIATNLHPIVSLHFSILNKKVSNIQVHTQYLLQKINELNKLAMTGGITKLLQLAQDQKQE